MREKNAANMPLVLPGGDLSVFPCNRNRSCLPWNLNLLDAQGNATSESYGNGLWLQNTFDTLTGLPLTRQSGTGGSPGNVQNLGYAWDAAGNLQSRQDLRQGLTESFSYDALDRLTLAAGPASLSINYDAIGNITSRSDTRACQVSAVATTSCVALQVEQQIRRPGHEHVEGEAHRLAGQDLGLDVRRAARSRARSGARSRVPRWPVVVAVVALVASHQQNAGLRLPSQHRRKPARLSSVESLSLGVIPAREARVSWPGPRPRCGCAPRSCRGCG